MVSQLEQAKAAAEALVSMGVIQNERIEPNLFNFDKEDTSKSFLHHSDFSAEDPNEAATQESLTDFKVIHSLPLTEPPLYFEAEPGEDQAMPVTDDVSPSHYFSTGIRYPKFQKPWNNTDVPFKTFQSLLYWKSEEDEVKLTCKICDLALNKNCHIQNHLQEHLGSLSQNEENGGVQITCRKAENPVSEGTGTLKARAWRQFRPWYQCSFCSERLDSKQDLRKHLQAYHAANTKCESCGHDAFDVCEAILHRQTCYEVKKVKEWECRKCLEIFSIEEELKVSEISYLVFKKKYFKNYSRKLFVLYDRSTNFILAMLTLVMLVVKVYPKKQDSNN